MTEPTRGSFVRPRKHHLKIGDPRRGAGRAEQLTFFLVDSKMFIFQPDPDQEFPISTHCQKVRQSHGRPLNNRRKIVDWSQKNEVQNFDRSPRPLLHELSLFVGPGCPTQTSLQLTAEHRGQTRPGAETQKNAKPAMIDFLH